MDDRAYLDKMIDECGKKEDGQRRGHLPASRLEHLSANEKSLNGVGA